MRTSTPHERFVSTRRRTDTGTVTSLTVDEPDATDHHLLLALSAVSERHIPDGEDTFEVDLARISRSDTRLIAILIRSLGRAKQRQRHLRLIISPEVKSWLDLCRVSHLFDTTDEAPENNA